MNKLFVICIITLMLISSSATSYGAVEGITSENYSDYEKPIADEYGYNKGECEKEYIEGEEQFYNEYYDHWNVDKVYSESVVIEEENTIEENTIEEEPPTPTTTPTTTKATTPKPQKPKAKSTKATTTKAKKPQAKSNKALAKEWAKAHGGGFKIKKLVTISNGGKKGKVKGTSYIVKYPKKVKKGKRVTCYMIEKNNEVYAMVCLGKVK